MVEEKKKENEDLEQLQLAEQELRNIELQKQLFQIELNDSSNALREIEKETEIYKIIGSLMIKTETNKIIGELERKKKILELRIKALEKQESIIKKKVDKLREEALKRLK